MPQDLKLTDTFAKAQGFFIPTKRHMETHRVRVVFSLLGRLMLLTFQKVGVGEMILFHLFLFGIFFVLNLDTVCASIFSRDTVDVPIQQIHMMRNVNQQTILPETNSQNPLKIGPKLPQKNMIHFPTIPFKAFYFHSYFQIGNDQI